MRSDWKRPETYSLPAEGEIRIKLRVAYDGSFYHGWQAQGNAVSVQGTISSCLSELFGTETMVYGSGRTDRGVHALSQVCHFDTASTIKPETYALILNTRLPKSIRILSSEEAPEGFHARFSTMSREYWYLAQGLMEGLQASRHSLISLCLMNMLQCFRALMISLHMQQLKTLRFPKSAISTYPSGI